MGDPDRPVRIRLVPQGDERSSPAPRRSPGAAVLLILFYALLFAAGLWWLRARSPLFLPRSASSGPAPLRPRSAASAASPFRSSRTAGSAAARASSSSAPDRAALDRHSLLAGEGLEPGAHEEYDRRLSAQRCTCGCDLVLRACLARDSACVRSAEIAEKIRKSLP